MPTTSDVASVLRCWSRLLTRYHVFCCPTAYSEQYPTLDDDKTATLIGVIGDMIFVPIATVLTDLHMTREWMCQASCQRISADESFVCLERPKTYS